MKLTTFERLLLVNQYRILEQVDEDGAEDWARTRKALEYGFELECEDIAAHIFDGLSSDECREVLQTLAMYDALQRSRAALGGDAGVSEQDVRFPGYDGNNETSLMSYVRYVVNDTDRFSFVKAVSPDYNSHMPMRSRYRAMLAAWQDLGESYELSREDIVRILQRG